MEKDRANKQLRLKRSEWLTLGRPELETHRYTVPFSQAPSLAQEAIAARRRFLEIDESEFPAGAARSQVAQEKRQGIRITEELLRELSEFLPREVSFGDQVENDLRNLDL